MRTLQIHELPHMIRWDTALTISSWEHIVPTDLEGAYKLLYEILGYESYKQMVENWNAESARACEALLGPRGRAIYKMIKAKRSAECTPEP